MTTHTDIDATTLEFLALLEVGEWTSHYGIPIERTSRDGLDKFHVLIGEHQHPAATSNAAMRLAEDAAGVKPAA